MKAVVSRSTGPADVRVVEVGSPAPGPDEIVVKVKASALNRADLLQVLGLYPAPHGVPADIPGLEYAGEVAQLGARVTRWKVGDRVMGIVGGGAWAEELVTHEREAIAVPDGVDLARAAAIPEAFITAFDALILQAGLTRGQSALIHAVASGVGTAALQLCRLWGAQAIGTGRNAAKLERAKQLGLEHGVLVKDGAFSAQVKQHTGGRGCQVALDLVGGAWFPQTVDCLAPGGTLMLVGLVGGVAAEAPLRQILSQKLRIVGTTLRSRALEEKIAVARQFEAQVVPAFARGALEPVIDATLPFSSVREGLDRLAANDSFGKLVLTW
ncbi:MAG: NAD(P)H-quinone oxidoreductase [Myxococcaceae bacterium]